MQASPGASSNRPVYSCTRCSDRKVKCDRQHPSCGACLKHNVECSYRPSKQSRKKQKRANKEDLLGRLHHYESILKQEGLDASLHAASTTSDPAPLTLLAHDGEWKAYPTADRGRTQIPTPSSITSDVNPYFNKTQLLPGRKRSEFVDNSLMSRVAEEFPNNDSRHTSENASDEDESDDHGDIDLLAGTDSRSKLIHPAYSMELWQIYVDNVDPVAKILHVPSLQASFKKAITNLDHVPRSFEPLIWAIYSLAILSIRDDECQQRFGQERQGLLTHFIAGTKHALARADFTSSTNIVVLQALVLHIVSIRDDAEPRSLWILTGVAMRLARSMGIHRDPKSLGVPPFEAELRKRIWYYINMHDNRAAEMCGQPKFKNLEGIPEPIASMNDKDIYPGMTETPTSPAEATDTIFIAILSEYFAFASLMSEANRKHLGVEFSADSFADPASIMPTKDIIQQIQDTIETKYLRYCDPSIPLQFLATLFARHNMSVARFMSNHPRRWKNREDMPEATRNLVWDVGCKILEQFDMLQSSRHIQRFAWNFKYYLQWHALIHVLDVLRIEPRKSDAYRAWQLVEMTFNNNPHIIQNTKRSLYVAVGNLCLGAWTAREASHPATRTIPVPQYILDLRQRTTNKRKNSKKSATSTIKTGATAFPAETDYAVSHPDLRSEQILSYTPGSNYWLEGWNDASFVDQPGLTSLDYSAGSRDATDVESQQIDWNAWDSLLTDTGFHNQSSFAV